jgi:hypothetical protein
MRGAFELGVAFCRSWSGSARAAHCDWLRCTAANLVECVLPEVDLRQALRLWREKRGRRHLGELLEHARTCRVEKVMRPYLEAVL